MPRASPRSCCATTSGQHVGLLAPLVVNRKGVYTDLAKWAKARVDTRTLRIDDEFLKVDPFPRIDRFKEHTIELPVGSILVTPENEAELRSAAEQGARSGQGRACTCCTPLDGLAAGHGRRRHGRRAWAR